MVDQSRNKTLQKALKKDLLHRKMTVRPQNAEETSHSEIKYETNDNSNHMHKPKKDKKANPELERCSIFLLTVCRQRMTITL